MSHRHKSAAEALRKYTMRSNELHRQYLDEPWLSRRYERFIRAQRDYLLPFYDDLRAKPGYSAAIDFVVTDLTGAGIGRRDYDLSRVLPIMTRMLPTRALQSLASAMELNARVLELNLAICQRVFARHGIDDEISEYDYCVSARDVSELDDCLWVVKMTRSAGDDLQRITRIPMIRATLRAMRSPAKAMGFSALQGFLESGYTIFTALPDADQFLDDIEGRMTEVFTRIYTAPMADLRR